MCLRLLDVLCRVVSISFGIVVDFIVVCSAKWAVIWVWRKISRRPLGLYCEVTSAISIIRFVVFKGVLNSCRITSCALQFWALWVRAEAVCNREHFDTSFKLQQSSFLYRPCPSGQSLVAVWWLLLPLWHDRQRIPAHRMPILKLISRLWL